MLAVHEGRLADAQIDLLTCPRLVHLEGRGRTVIDVLVGCATDSIAFVADIGMLRSGRLSEEELEKFQQALEEFSPLPSSAEKINLFERLSALDTVGPMARQGFKGFERVIPFGCHLAGRNSLARDAEVVSRRL